MCKRPEAGTSQIERRECELREVRVTLSCSGGGVRRGREAQRGHLQSHSGERVGFHGRKPAQVLLRPGAGGAIFQEARPLFEGSNLSSILTHVPISTM